jgi:hypothetical protein
VSHAGIKPTSQQAEKLQPITSNSLFPTSSNRNTQHDSITFSICHQSKAEKGGSTLARDKEKGRSLYVRAF